MPHAGLRAKQAVKRQTRFYDGVCVKRHQNPNRRLIYPDFVTKTGYARLADLYRYLTAIERRLDKLLVDSNTDRAKMLRVEAVQEAYKQLLAKLPKSKAVPDEVLEIRYMIEELRVSLFAQQLGTKYPISDKRILNAINEIK